MFAPLTPQERLNLHPRIVERIIVEHEQAELALLTTERQSAFQRLAELEKEEQEALRSLNKELSAAVAEEKAALKKWTASRNRLGAIQARRSALSARFTARKSRCETAIGAVTPPLVAEFISEVEADLQRIHPPQQDDEVLYGTQSYGYSEGPAVLVKKSTEQSVSARSQAIVDAVQAARGLAAQNLDELELRKRLDDLRSSLPEIKFKRVAST